MSKYTQDVTKLLELVGGKENINAVTHCLTRMRFALADPSLAQTKEIEKLRIVKGSFVQAGQFQVIVGNEVPDVYNEFVAVAGISAMSKDETKKAAKSNLTPLQKLMDNMAEIFSPLIPALVIGGLILGFRNIIAGIGFFNTGLVDDYGYAMVRKFQLNHPSNVE